MTVAEVIEEIRPLPPKDKQHILETLWDQFGEELEPYDTDLTAEQLAELDRRAEELQKNPHSGIPAEQVFAELEERLAARRKDPVGAAKADILKELRRMPEAERREFVEIIGLEFGDLNDELTQEQKAELNRRAEDALKHPGRGTPIEDISAEIRQRLLAPK